MAEPVVLDSRVREVSVFRSGAMVTRLAEVKPDGAWPDEIALVGLPLAIDDESVRVSVTGPADAKLPRPADVRVDLVVPPVGEPLLPPDEKELRAAQDEVDRLGALLERVDRELARLDGLSLTLADPFENRPPKPAPAAAWSGVLDWRHRWKRERAEERKRVGEDLMRAREHLARLHRRLQELRASQDGREAQVSKRVRLRLRDGGSPVAATLRLEYRIPGARWVPTYTLRIARDGKSAQLAVKALVVQSSGEPWERVKLSVSTADLLRDTELPELKSLRIGRRQPEPPRRAWRDPPSGLDTLFAGLDQSLSTMRPPPPVAPPIAPPEPPPPPPPPPLAQAAAGGAAADALYAPEPELSAPADDFDDDERQEQKKEVERRPMMAKRRSVTGRASGAAMPGKPMPPGAPPPAPAMSGPAPAPFGGMPARPRKSDLAGLGDDEGAAFGAELGRMDLAPEPGVMRFSDLVMSGWQDAGARGRLRPVTVADRLAGLDSSHAPGVARRLAEAEANASRASHVSFPTETQDVSVSSGSYDHRYDAEGLVDVPGDGRIHAVPLLARTAPVASTLVVVPRESNQAVRVAELRNPLEAPLLAGPAEIYLDDEYLVTSPIRTVPAGADLRVGLGVEEALKVARNTFYEEEATGLLGGGAAFHHRIEIELANRLSAPVKVEVRERVPLKHEENEDVEIVIPPPTPAWEDFDQAETSRIRGGKRWQLTLAAGESKKIHWTYSIKIDAKNELVGGNRRE